MVSDGVREVCAHIFQTEDISDELGEIVGVLGDFLGALCELCIANVFGNELLLVAGSTRAGAGGNHNCVPLSVENWFESLDVVARDLCGVFKVAGVCMHLTAADLAFWEDDFMAEALQQRHCRLGGLGEHDVCQAS